MNYNELLMKVYSKSPQIVQTMGINLMDLHHRMLISSKEYQVWDRLLRKSETWTLSEFQEYQNKHLRRVVFYAYNNISFYKRLYDDYGVNINSIRTIDDLEKLPVIRKEQIINNCDILSKPTKSDIIQHTSGTTGKPLTIRISHSNDVLFKAVSYGRRNVWSNYNSGWIARFVGDRPVKNCNELLLYRKSYIMRRAIFPSYCISLKTLPRIISDLKYLNIEYIWAYPSTAYLIAKYLQMLDVYLPMKGVFYSSEPMYELQKGVITERFKSKCYGFYGQAEEVVSAVECGEGKYHLTMIDGIMEVSLDSGNVPPGDKGFVIATSLHNYAMPLIRYKLGDYTGYQDCDCQCNRISPTIYPIETKMEDFIVTPDGKIISPSLLTFPLKYSNDIIESQVVKTDLNEINVYIVRGERFNEQDAITLRESFKSILGNQMIVNIICTEKIHSTSAFKKRFVINMLGRDYIETAFNETK